jgi:GH15 family glucan-1,4-alpha-glucosidase
MKYGETKKWNPETGNLEATTKDFWSVSKTPTGKSKIVDHNGFSVANLSGTVAKDNDKNAKLIAAAPDLLKALEDLVEKCLHSDAYNQKVDELYNAQQAIQKARA